jgi:hypothetical protein
MSREKPSGRASGADDMEGMLRHPDGSLDVAAYAKLAHRERAAAIAASMREGILIVRAMLSAIAARLAPAVRSEAASGKHHATARR